MPDWLSRLIRKTPDPTTAQAQRELEVLTEAIAEHLAYHGTLNRLVGISLGTLVALVTSYCNGQRALLHIYEVIFFVCCLATIILTIISYSVQRDLFPRTKSQVNRDALNTPLDTAQEYFVQVETITSYKRLSFRLIAGITAIDWLVFIIGYLAT